MQHLDLDVEQFWKDDELAHQENCFSADAPQAALGIRMSDECVFAELGEEGEPWGYTPPERRYELNCRYNEKAVKIVAGRCETESSGGITFDNMIPYAKAGVDFISFGALTHSVKGLDMSFKAAGSDKLKI